MSTPDIFAIEREVQSTIAAAPAAVESTVNFLQTVLELVDYTKKLEYVLEELPIAYEQELDQMTAFFTADGERRHGDSGATGALGNALRRLRAEAKIEED